MSQLAYLVLMINLNQKLTILGEEPMNVLVKTETGEETMLPRERMTNYVRVDNMLIPKDNVEWL
jgi:hypothetical protein